MLRWLLTLFGGSESLDDAGISSGDHAGEHAEWFP